METYRTLKEEDFKRVNEELEVLRKWKDDNSISINVSVHERDSEYLEDIYPTRYNPSWIPRDHRKRVLDYVSYSNNSFGKDIPTALQEKIHEIMMPVENAIRLNDRERYKIGKFAKYLRETRNDLKKQIDKVANRDIELDKRESKILKNKKSVVGFFILGIVVGVLIGILI